MRFTIVGVGGVGGYFAGRLKNAGNIVQIIARGEHLDRIRNDGLKIITDSEEFTVRPDVSTDDVSGLGPADVVVVAVKAFQVRDMLKEIAPLVGNDTSIMTIQNGVEAYEDLAESYPERAIGGLTRVISYIESPGVIRKIGPEAALTMGRVDGDIDDKLQNVVNTFKDAGIICNVSGTIKRDIWEKFMIMATMGGVGSITQAPVGALISVSETKELIETSLDEVEKVARSIGVSLDQESREKVWSFFRSLPYNATSSTQRDIAAGKPSEIGYLSGTVARIGEKNNVHVPLHRFIYMSLTPSELRARGELSF